MKLLQIRKKNMKAKSIIVAVFLLMGINAGAQNREEMIATADSLHELSWQQANDGKVSLAVKTIRKAISIKDSLYGTEDSSYLASRLREANFFARIGNFKKALDITKEVYNTQTRTHQDNSKNFITATAYIGQLYYNLKEMDSALAYFEQTAMKCEELGDTLSNNYISSTFFLAKFCIESGKLQSGIDWGQKSEHATLETYKDDTASLIPKIIILGSIYFEQVPQNTIRILGQYLPLYKQKFGNDKTYYGNRTILANAHMNAGDYYKAISIYEELYQDTNQWYPTMKLDNINNLAICYSELELYQEAEAYEREAVKLFKEMYGEYSRQYGTSINNLSNFCSMNGDQEEAEMLNLEASAILDSVAGKEDIDYQYTLHRRANIYSRKGDVGKAIALQREALLSLQKIDSKESVKLQVNTMHNLSDLYNKINRYEESFYYGNKAKELAETVYEKSDVIYFQILSEYANCLEGIGRKEDAKKVYDELMVNMDEAGVPSCSKTRITPLLNSAQLYTFDSMIAIYNHLLSNCDFKDDRGRANINNNLSIVYRQKSMYNEARKCAQEALRLADIRGVIDNEYIKALNNMAIVEAKDGNADAYAYYVCKETEAVKKYITDNLITLSNKDRGAIWEMYQDIIEGKLPIAVVSHPVDSTIEYGYNGALFSKGLLLNTEQSINSIIAQSGDSEAMRMLSELRLLHGQISKLYDMEPSERFCPVDSLERVAADLDRSLVNQSKQYGDFTKNLSFEWRDVKAALKKGEAAVEFVCFTQGKEDSVCYAAYVLHYNDAAPHWVTLSPLSKNEQLLNSSEGHSINISNWLWRELENELENIHTVYFSPIGELYQIPIESLPDYKDSTRLISDRYNLYRLSSTRELAKDKKKANIKNGRIYGGLRYDATIDTSMRESNGQRSFTYSPWSPDSLSISRGNKVAFLPGTLTEAKAVYDLMKRASIKSELFTDTLGTEHSFKQLSGSDVNIIQIGTHGFYYDGKQGVESERESVVGEDKSMTRSGLLFAGANMTLKNGIPNASTYNDGILTAAEVAYLDLKNVDLVVLSACESGLGELKGDGVFGLQRGFKKAGVNSIIMSLWKVDDRATQMLMTQFYENWLIKKMTKQNALKAAQEWATMYAYSEAGISTDLMRNAPTIRFFPTPKEKAMKYSVPDMPTYSNYPTADGLPFSSEPEETRRFQQLHWAVKPSLLPSHGQKTAGRSSEMTARSKSRWKTFCRFSRKIRKHCSWISGKVYRTSLF